MQVCKKCVVFHKSLFKVTSINCYVFEACEWIHAFLRFVCIVAQYICICKDPLSEGTSGPISVTKIPLKQNRTTGLPHCMGLSFHLSPDYMSHPESMNVAYGLFIYVYVHIGVCIIFSWGNYSLPQTLLTTRHNVPWVWLRFLSNRFFHAFHFAFRVWNMLGSLS